MDNAHLTKGISLVPRPSRQQEFNRFTVYLKRKCTHVIQVKYTRLLQRRTTQLQVTYSGLVYSLKLNGHSRYVRYGSYSVIYLSLKKVLDFCSLVGHFHTAFFPNIFMQAEPSLRNRVSLFLSAC